MVSQSYCSPLHFDRFAHDAFRGLTPLFCGSPPYDIGYRYHILSYPIHIYIHIIYIYIYIYVYMYILYVYMIRYVYSIDHVTCSTYVCICAAAILDHFSHFSRFS